MGHDLRWSSFAVGGKRIGIDTEDDPGIYRLLTTV
jgi:hypothetical protein